MLEAVRANVSKDAATNIERWLNEPKYAEYKAELESLILGEEWKTLEDSFYTTIEFGTAGIRGSTGLGSARISRVTIGEATQALCDYIVSLDDSAKDAGIVIAHDTRLTSVEFAELAASVCAGNGVMAYIFDGYRSTPELSFAVRYLKASAGIVISASHNPPSDNGFKAYLSDGAQLVSPHDQAVTELVRKTEEIRSSEFYVGVEIGDIDIIGKEVDEAYINAVASQAVGEARDLSIVYSPLHGAGQRNTIPVLEAAGFSISTVASQMTPDGNFPTVENNKPNPEERAANDLAVAQMMSTEADIAITNDPDADRIGVMVRQGEEPKYLSGNQTAALATEFVLSQVAQKGNLTNQHYIAKTVVTTDLMDAIANRYGAKVYGDMLIGFKYIGELLLQKESSNETFLIGAEESYGMLLGDYARDKDGAAGALVMAEYAAELRSQGMTLYDKLLTLYSEYGIFAERLDTIVCPGAKGFGQMQSIMAMLRSQPPKAVGSHEVTSVVDYQTLTRMYSDGTQESVPCSSTGNMIVLEFGDHRCRISVRPSGTEPKLKLYVQWHEQTEATELAQVEELYLDLQDRLEGISRELEGMLLNT